MNLWIKLHIDYTTKSPTFVVVNCLLISLVVSHTPGISHATSHLRLPDRTDATQGELDPEDSEYSSFYLFVDQSQSFVVRCEQTSLF